MPIFFMMLYIKFTTAPIHKNKKQGDWRHLILWHQFGNVTLESGVTFQLSANCFGPLGDCNIRTWHNGYENGSVKAMQLWNIIFKQNWVNFANPNSILKSDAKKIIRD